MKSLDFGTVEYDGAILKLIQWPYIDTDFTCSPNVNYYRATAIDDNEDCYKIRWDIINADCEDESEACDWEEYEVTPL